MLKSCFNGFKAASSIALNCFQTSFFMLNFSCSCNLKYFQLELHSCVRYEIIFITRILAKYFKCMIITSKLLIDRQKIVICVKLIGVQSIQNIKIKTKISSNFIEFNQIYQISSLDFVPYVSNKFSNDQTLKLTLSLIACHI